MSSRQLKKELEKKREITKKRRSKAIMKKKQRDFIIKRQSKNKFDTTIDEKSKSNCIANHFFNQNNENYTNRFFKLTNEKQKLKKYYQKLHVLINNQIRFRLLLNNENNCSRSRLQRCFQLRQ